MDDQSQRQQNPVMVLRDQLEKSRGEIAKVLPKDIDPDRFLRTVMTAAQLNQDLIFADRRSLIASCMKAAQDGLLPDGREAVLNIYNTKMKDPQTGAERWMPTVQYLPMVRGLLKVLRNSGEIAHIDAAAVYEKDEFIFERGDDAKIVHRPYLGAEDPGPVIAAYVIAKLANGEVHREVMPRRDIEKTREASKAGNAANGPWSKWYDQMAIKAVIKRAAKLLPQSSDRIIRVIEHDNEAMGFDFNQRGADASQALEAPQQTLAIPNQRPSRLAAILGAKKAEPVPVDQGQVDDGAAAEQE